ncbi:MAG: cytochrome b/b6 domain-containing protein [Allosphingosinicella sp.]
MSGDGERPALRKRIRIWDGPTRLFHWSLVILIAAAWWTAEEEMLDWHSRIGFAILFLLVFRFVWGLIGSSTARFAGFVRGPREIVDYLRGSRPPAVGHNPLGALSVLALLGLTSLVVLLGLFATDDDGLAPGPLSHLVSYDAAEEAQDLHELGFNLLLALVGVHIAAILYYAILKRQNLVAPMVTGRGAAPEGAEPMRPAPAWRLAVAWLAAFAVAWWVWSGAPALW